MRLQGSLSVQGLRRLCRKKDRSLPARIAGGNCRETVTADYAIRARLLAANSRLNHHSERGDIPGEWRLEYGLLLAQKLAQLAPGTKISK